jgi:hypothetical protein
MPAAGTQARSKLALNPLPLQNPNGGAFSLTRVSGFGAAVAGLLTAINPTWKIIFGADTPTWAKPVFMMVVVLAWALIAVADVLGRSYVGGQRSARVTPLPATVKAKDTKGSDQLCEVVAVRFDPADQDNPSFLVVKAGEGSEWVEHGDLVFQAHA